VTQSLIDLDAAPPPDLADRHRPWPPWLHTVRRPLAVVAALLATTVLGAAGAPAARRFTAPARIPGAFADDFVLVDDGVLVRAGEWRELRSYGLDGQRRWAVPPPLRFFAPVGVLGDLALVSSPPPGETAALDRASGAVRWSTDGAVFATAGDVVVVGFGGDAASFTDGVRVLVGVGRTDGIQRWRADVDAKPQIAIFTAGLGGGWLRGGLGLIDGEGTGRLLDLGTGRWRPLTGLPVSFSAQRAFGFVVDDLTVVYVGRPVGPGTVLVYGPDGGAPLWTAMTPGLDVTLCGRSVCVPDGARTRVLDLRSGVEWTRVDWPGLIRGGGSAGLLGYARPGGGSESTRVAAIDARTGRLVRMLNGWDVVPADHTDWVPIVRRDTGLRWRLAAFSLSTGVMYPIDTFEPAGQRACQATATHVACAVRSGDVLVWGYRPRR
jgi:hypothetical protein